MSKKYIYHTIKVLTLLIGIALSIKALKEPDLFWQITTGQWILSNHKIPVTDIFSYTFYGSEWINIKWGFEVLAALVANTMGAESVFIIQMIITSALILLLYKWMLYFLNHATQGNFYTSSVYASVLLILFCISYRINGRPEMFSHLFTVLYIYFYNKYAQSKKLFFILLFQVFWTNLHEAFGIGLIIAFIYSAASWLQVYFYQFNKSKAINITLTALLLWPTVCINPYGYKMLLKPLEIFKQLETNKYTTELLDYTMHEYWQKEAYMAIFILLVIFIGITFTFFNNRLKQKIKSTINIIGLGNLLSLLAFTFLAATAYRNIVFLFLVSAPFFAYTLNIIVLFFIKRYPKILNLKMVVFYAMALMALIFYASVVSGKFYETFNSNDRYGLAIYDEHNPEGAARFLEENNLHKHLVFTDYLSSSYLLYRLQPYFKTFLDLRDLDVFPNSFFQQNAEAYVNYNVFKKLEQQYKFNTVVLLNGIFGNLRNALMADTSYNAVFANALTTVFVKQRKDSANQFIYKPNVNIINGKFATFINKFFNPFYTQPVYTKASFKEHEAEYYLSVGLTKKAKVLAQDLLNADEKNEHAAVIMAQYYVNLSFKDTTTQHVYMDSAMQFYNKVIALNPNNTEAIFGMGTVAFRKNNLLTAVKYFEKSCEINNDFLNGHLYAAEAYKSILNTNENKKYVAGFLHHLIEGNRLNPNNPNIEWNLGVAYYKSGNCKKAVKYMEKVINFSGLSVEDVNTANAVLINCKGKY